MSNWYIGTIGFSYKDWVGEFYPKGMSQRDYLTHYSKVFNSVEIDTTFHSIPRSSLVQSWSATTPPSFKFCPKSPRAITHELSLQASESMMLEFLDALEPIHEKTGPVLIQLPPSFTQDSYADLAKFLAALPNSFHYAVEFRHGSWFNHRTTQLLTEHHVGWVAIDYPNLPKRCEITTDFLYIRWIGFNGLYHHHSYERVDKTEQLRWWLQTITHVEDQVSSIYGFFNNDYAGFAAGTGRRFLVLAGLKDDEQDTPYQERLF